MSARALPTLRLEIRHLVEFDAPKVSKYQVRARCGAVVDRFHGSKQPVSCETCLKLQGEDDRALAAVQDSPF